MKNYRIFEEKVRKMLYSHFGSDYCLVRSSEDQLRVYDFKHGMCSTTQIRFISDMCTKLGLTWYISFNDGGSLVMY